ncbi:hypothetical protein L3Q67_15745 [Saccharothrix sp. AJ9571]|nr:hypothetical protein L3Q67_15745 [Saccharothrix sp. AJ9571]
MTGTHDLVLTLITDSSDHIAVGAFTYDLAIADECPEPKPGLPFAIPLTDIEAPTYGAYVLRVDVDGARILELQFVVEKHLSEGVTGSLMLD